ncbi:DNA polymerase III gamma/tau subunit-like domain-containing protein [Pandoravirus kuranda]|uniref:DNA polymerase III gamma/tau subunit-like domain-containing protein n=1 Tax=Pandoravirus kuranda TaxID=3019033 RepID=A0AA95ENR0_9VIRU|nr:DNA polymerase III gamma/tau subunit-like domain-containing protein [Pandoravirus kuranda]
MPFTSCICAAHPPPAAPTEMDRNYGHIVPAGTHRAPLSVKDALKRTPNMNAQCMHVLLDIDEMIGLACKEHALHYPYDPLVHAIRCRRWTADSPGAVDLVAMHIDWHSDCRYTIAQTALHHCRRMVSCREAGVSNRAVLSAHVAKEDGATKAWLQLYLEPVDESDSATPSSSSPLDTTDVADADGDGDAMACETLPLREPLPIDPVPLSLLPAAPSADTKASRKCTEQGEATPQGVLKVLGLYPCLSIESRKTLAALVRSFGSLACDWVADVGPSPLSPIIVPARGDTACVVQRIKNMVGLHGRVSLSASSQPSGGIVLTVAPSQGRTSPKGDAKDAPHATATPPHFILPKPEPVDTAKTIPTTTIAKADNVCDSNVPPAQPTPRSDSAPQPPERAVPRATAPPAQTPMDIVTLYPTMTTRDAGYVFAAENQLVGVPHHWVIPTTMLAMRTKCVTVSLRAAPAAMARAVAEHAGLREGTKKVVLALCGGADETARVLCSIVDVLPGPEKQSPTQLAALYPHLALTDAVSVGALEARLCAVPHVWVTRWPNAFPSQRALLAADTAHTLGIADLLSDGMVGHENAWLVLSLERSDDGNLWLCYSRASPQTTSA